MKLLFRGLSFVQLAAALGLAYIHFFVAHGAFGAEDMDAQRGLQGNKFALFCATVILVGFVKELLVVREEP